MKFEGLSWKEAKKRLKIYGENKIERKEKVSPLKIFLSQFISPIVILLIVAAIISFGINFYSHESYFDSILILAIVFASAIAGFVQEYKAEKAIEALQKLATPKAKVIREGKEVEIPATEVVPGDLLVLESGDVIAADGEILEGDLQVDESILTGESRAVRKKKGSKVFSSTSVYVGRAIVKVTATGMKTEIGKIASKMQEIKEEKTPFQQHMEQFSKKLVYLSVLIIFITFGVGVVKFGLLESFLISVSLAVAAIPEGLPAVITVALSLGAKQMAKRNALIRKLAVTESVGSVNVICTDKTGTITEGKMKVVNIWLLEDSKLASEMAVNCCFYCNDSKIISGKLVGDETDVALKEFSSKHVKQKDWRRIEEIPFSSERKFMAVAVETPKKKLVFLKGALEVVIDKCTRVLVGNKITEMDEKLKTKILEKNSELARKGLRVLALAYKVYNRPLDKDLVFVGLVALQDPPRKEVKEAIEECYSAGIRVIMITGDNPETAKAIADQVGLKTNGVIIGREIDSMSDEKLKEALDKGINIFARTNPFHKLRILEVLQKSGNVVAMTGDGVNDALALKKADVGISIGIRGTEVAKEASDIILLDDNFASIRNAVKEGRRIFDNIRKFVDYLLTCNVAEVTTVLLATIFFPFIALYPAQILWINLITDGLPALALSVDPARPDVMKRKPRKKEEGIINKRLAFLIGGIGIKKSLVIIGTFLAALPFGIDVARTVLFTGFIMYEFVRIAVIRYNEKMLSFKYWFANKFLVVSLIVSFLLQLMIIYTPIGQYFKVVPLGIVQWSILIVGTVVGFVLGILIAKIVEKFVKEEY